jgi:hypothetical protein
MKLNTKKVLGIFLLLCPAFGIHDVFAGKLGGSAVYDPNLNSKDKSENCAGITLMDTLEKTDQAFGLYSDLSKIHEAVTKTTTLAQNYNQAQSKLAFMKETLKQQSKEHWSDVVSPIKVAKTEAAQVMKPSVESATTSASETVFSIAKDSFKKSISSSRQGRALKATAIVTYAALQSSSKVIDKADTVSTMPIL